ncbi:MAG: hydrogenase maturation protease [Phyllobacteriaceae bacterium]|nr:hydrogenase maturation protease [Phyllobacteriaceae bacterium]
MAKTSTLVIGIGNPTAGDDAAGRLVARKLCARDDRDFDVAENFGETASLIALFEGRSRVILVDACQCEAEPGAIFRFSVGDAPLPVALGGISSHGFGAGAAIALAKALGLLPEEMIVFAIAGEKFEPETRPTRAVCESIVSVAAEIDALARAETRI